MITKLKTYSAFLFITLFFCGASVPEAASKRKPKWVTNRPVDNNYYIGIGKASKIESTEDYMQIAKNNALSDIISEISVKISSNSLLSQIEDNAGYRETFEAQIKIAAKDDIEDYEIVDSWEDKKEYWVYYRLSKADYQRKKRERLDRAKNLSKDFYEKAQDAEKEYDINNALIYYVKAFDAIKKHLGEDLSVFTFDGRVLLDNAIYQSIQDIFSRIRIVPGKDKYKTKALSSDNEPVFVKVKLKTELETQNISNLPITFSFSDLNTDKTENVISLNNGKAECTIASIAPKGRTQIIRAELNTDIYFGDDSPQNILKMLFNERGIKPYGNINVVVTELIAYLESEEILLESTDSEQPITKLFKEELSEYFFSFTNNKEEADAYIKINSAVQEGEKLGKHNLHTSFLSCEISIARLKDNVEVFNEKLINIKGMKSGSFEAAAMDAIAKAEEKIKSEIIPNIRKINL